MNTNGYDRKADDLGNIVGFEHVNVTIPDQSTAVTFYVLGLGLTRDPYMNVGLNNMWVNVGGQQFHLPTRGIQKIPGHIGLVLSDIEALKRRLAAVEPELKGTRFKWREAAGHVAVTGPWGNRFRCHAPAAEFGDMTIGMPYVEFLTRPGTARAIGKFYRSVLQAPVAYGNGSARVKVGRNQSLIFTETDRRIPKFDGHHIAIYIANHSRAHQFLLRRGLIMGREQRPPVSLQGHRRSDDGREGLRVGARSAEPLPPHGRPRHGEPERWADPAQLHARTGRLLPVGARPHPLRQ